MQMPRYCKYCHAEGHTVADCDKKKDGFSCWACGGVKNMVGSCPKDVPQKKARAKANKSSPISLEFLKKASVSGLKRRRAGSSQPQSDKPIMLDEALVLPHSLSPSGDTLPASNEALPASNEALPPSKAAIADSLTIYRLLLSLLEIQCHFNTGAIKFRNKRHLQCTGQRYGQRYGHRYDLGQRLNQTFSLSLSLSLSLPVAQRRDDSSLFSSQ
ncbi:hypothetical protein EDC96DRAFT_604824 [Choanephora cucurbitarum]|nr:hypothetical protein EDC96DRAFT_604824 [Choanephora cucurbitarum]